MLFREKWLVNLTGIPQTGGFTENGVEFLVETFLGDWHASNSPASAKEFVLFRSVEGFFQVLFRVAHTVERVDLYNLARQIPKSPIGPEKLDLATVDSGKINRLHLSNPFLDLTSDARMKNDQPAAFLAFAWRVGVLLDDHTVLNNLPNLILF